MSTAAPPKQSAAEEQLARLRQRSDVAKQEAGGEQSSPDAKGGQPEITAARIAPAPCTRSLTS
jgi:hypothetical protein